MTENARKVLMVASEAVPFAKSGGLADVVTALSNALRNTGVDVRVAMPRYANITKGDLEVSARAVPVPSGISSLNMDIYEATLPRGDVPIYFIDQPGLFERDGIYGDRSNKAFADNARRFAALNRAAFELCRTLNWIPDVFHVHDWPTGLVPAYLHYLGVESPFLLSATVMTIHNIGYQGVFPRQDLYYTNLPWEALKDDGDATGSQINFLRSGIRAADWVTTVSPTYAREIQTPAYGHGLDSLLVERKDSLAGILNGIDYGEWNPAADPLIPVHYTDRDLSGKERNKASLQKTFDLPVNPDVPLFGIVSRLVEQKGFFELVGPGSGSLHRICSEMSVQFVIVGTGETWCEEELRSLAGRLPNLRVFIGFDNAKAHLVEAGADFFLMPSRYEPCGLNQMYSLCYGTLPIVRRTGGLADTVDQYDQESGDGTGFVFDDLSPQSIYDVVGWAVWAWHNKRDHLFAMRRRAMRKRFSWEDAADRYVQAYDSARAHRRAAVKGPA